VSVDGCFWRSRAVSGHAATVGLALSCAAAGVVLSLIGDGRGAPSGILGLDAPEGELLAPGLAAAVSTAWAGLAGHRGDFGAGPAPRKTITS
jgi:hypothetical protein